MNPRSRRHVVALGMSLAVHVGLVAAGLGFAIWKGLPQAPPIEFEIAAGKTPAPQALPLGPPPVAKTSPGPARKSGRKPIAATVAGPGPPGDAGVDAGAIDAGGPTMADGGPGDAGPGDARAADGGRPGDPRSFGPEGSRVTAILRVDRLRESPQPAATIALADRILQWLPDRRRLVSGSAIDLFRDFDALLIATPNPRDDAVTFLAVQHHLDDDRLRGELAKAALAAGRTITWKVQAGRPVGMREIPPGVSPDRRADLARDDRFFVLPAPGIVVIAPPAYATLLLGSPAGAAAAGLPSASSDGWRALAERLAAENALVPAPAVFMLTASGLFSRTRAQELAARDPAAAPLRGLLPPGVVTVTIAVDPSPVADITGEFASDAEAAAWARELPRLKQQFVGNPLVLLAGLTQMLASLQVQRDDADGKIVHVRIRATLMDIERVVALVANLLGTRAPQ